MGKQTLYLTITAYSDASTTNALHSSSVLLTFNITMSVKKNNSAKWTNGLTSVYIVTSETASKQRVVITLN